MKRTTNVCETDVSAKLMQHIIIKIKLKSNKYCLLLLILKISITARNDIPVV